MSAVLKIERQQTALSLVRIGLRLSYIAAITGLNDRFLRKVWKEVHGKSPSSGTSYTSIDTGLKTYNMSRQSAAFANVYMATAPHERAKESMHAPTFLTAWLTYVELGINESLTPDLAWQVIRNLTAKSTTFTACKKCNSNFILFEKLNGQDCKCPFCYDADKRARKSEVAMVPAMKTNLHIHLVRERKHNVALPPGFVDRRGKGGRVCAPAAGADGAADRDEVIPHTSFISAHAKSA